VGENAQFAPMVSIWKSIPADEMIGKFSSHFWESVAIPLLDRTGAHMFKHLT
jgi:hypothetical protein